MHRAEFDDLDPFLSQRTEQGVHSSTNRRKALIYSFAGIGLGILFAALIVVLLVGVMPLGNPGGAKNTTARGRFFQLSDIHYDPLYLPNFNNTYHCRMHSLFHNGSSEASPSQTGVYNHTWGQYGCDSPLVLLESVLDAMLNIDKHPDFILITGDFVGHGLPTMQLANDSLTSATKLILSKFPDTPVFPVLGNNDVYPDYHLPYGPSAWLDYVASLWSPWLNQEGQQETFRSGGYYTAKVGGSNLRLIALNTVLYSTLFVPSNATSVRYPFTWVPAPVSDLADDPNGQFAWLKTQLDSARKLSERVIIAGHIPYGVNEWDGSPLWHSQYVTTYTDLINQYSDVVGNHIFAHFHTDEFRVFYSSTEKRNLDLKNSGNENRNAHHDEIMGQTKTEKDSTPSPISSMAIHPSISPSHFNNPSFRYYHFWQSSGHVDDYSHYYADLFFANYFGTPNWILEYTFKNAYNADGVDTAGFAQAYELVKSAGSSFLRFVDYKMASFAGDDRRSTICALSAGTADQYAACMQAPPSLPPPPPAASPALHSPNIRSAEPQQNDGQQPAFGAGVAVSPLPPLHVRAARHRKL